MCLRHLKEASVLGDSGECLQKRLKRQAGTRSLRGDLVKSSDLLEVQWAERHRTVLLRE